MVVREVGAGQVHQRDLMIGGGELPFFTFDCNASPVTPDTLTCASELVNKGCLARIWITN